jgi:hypothetical protein
LRLLRLPESIQKRNCFSGALFYKTEDDSSLKTKQRNKMYRKN